MKLTKSAVKLTHCDDLHEVPGIEMICQEIPSISPAHFPGRVLEAIVRRPWCLHTLSGHAANVQSVVEGEVVGAFRFMAAKMEFGNEVFDRELIEFRFRDQSRFDSRNPEPEVPAELAVTVI